MSGKELLQKLNSLKIGVTVHNGELRLKAPKGVMTSDLIEELRLGKNLLIDLINNANTSLGASPHALQTQLSAFSFQRIEIAADYALSSPQQRLWLLEKLHGPSVTYNMIAAFRLQGQLNTEAFRLSYAELVKRHESLRTVFTDRDGEPRQVVRDPNEPVISFQVITATHGQVAEILEKESGHLFNLETGPLARAVLLQLSAEEHIFVFNVHHIISDGWSMKVIVQDMIVMYHAYGQGMPSPLPPLNIQYKDFAAWQQEQLGTAGFQAHRTYWEKQFAGEIPVLNLPTYKPRPPVQNFSGHTLLFQFSPVLSKNIQLLCQELGGTLFMGLLSLVSATLSRYTGQDDLVIGSPVAGREHTELEDQVGFYSNTLAFRIRIDETDVFTSLFGNVKETALNAYMHQDYPFDKLVEDLNVHRDMSRSPVFDAMIVLQNEDADASASAVTGLKIDMLEAELKTAKFDLTFSFVESASGIGLGLNYSTELYEEWFIRQLGEHLTSFAEAAVSQKEILISRLEYLGKTEREKLLKTFNDTKARYADDKTLVDLFLEQASQSPGETALIFLNRAWTYRELADRSARFAHYLHATYKLEINRLVGIQLERSEWLIISMLAVLRTGAAYMPIDPSYPAERIGYLQSDSGCAAVIDEAEIGRFRAVEEKYSADCSYSVAGPADLAYVIYTSGSTGKPKGCLLKHQGIVNRLSWMWQYLQCTRKDVILQKTTFTFDVSVWEIFMPLCFGCKMVLCSEDDIYSPVLIAGLINKHSVSCVHFVPSMLSTFMENLPARDLPAQLSGLRAVITSGEALSLSTVQKWYAQSSIPIYNLYGPTEASIDVSYFKTGPATTKVLIGKPVWNTELFVLDKALLPVPAGVTGELYIGGIQLAAGYHNRPELTRERFINNPFRKGERLYRTGDICCWTGDGHLDYKGRSDLQVKIRGFRVEPGEVELALLQDPLIEQAAVLALDHTGHKELVAYLVSKHTLAGPAIMNRLKLVLPAYMIPSGFVQLPEMPVSPSGKINRKTLALQNGTGLPVNAAYVAPRNETEAKLVLIWEKILDKRVSIYDNFFELGGHSLKAMRVISRIVHDLSVNIALKELFLHPTVAELAQVVTAASSVSFEHIKNVGKQDDYPVSHAQRRLWILQQLDPDATTYNIPAVFACTGKMDQACLVRAFDELVRRHEILRTVFIVREGEPRQKIVPAASLRLALNVIDLSALDEKAAQAKQLVEAERTHVFTFEMEALVRATLIHLAEHEHMFIFNIHHIISDGWSLKLMLKEMIMLYQAFKQGSMSPLPELCIQYKDYTAWQSDLHATAAYEMHKKYWLDQFPENIPVLDLPSDFPRPLVRTSAGDSISIMFSGLFSAGVKALAKKEGMTGFMVLVCALKTLLYRYSNNGDIIIGMPVAGRQHAELEDQLGMYVNTLALRSVIHGKMPFGAAMKEVAAGMLNALEHQQFPFDELVDLLSPERNMGRSPLFDIMVDITSDEPEDKGDADGLTFTMEPFEGAGQTSKFDLTFNFLDTSAGMGLTVEFSTDLFRKERILEMAGDLERLTIAATGDQQLLLDEIEYISEAVKQNLLSSVVPGPVRNYPHEHVLNIFQGIVAHFADTIAVKDHSTQITYAALNKYADAVAGNLKKVYGVRKGDRVALLCDRSVNLIAGMLGVLKANAVYIPLDTNIPEKRLQYILEDAAATILVSDTDSCKDSVFPVERIELQSLFYGEENPDNNSPGEGTDAAYMIYTSGSTGNPKGVLINHQSLSNYTQYFIEYFAICSSDKVIQGSSVAFDLSVDEIYPVLLSGGLLYISQKGVSATDEFLEELQDNEITVLSTVPAVVEYLNHVSFRSKPLRTVISGGDVIKRNQICNLSAALSVYNSYGPTEATVCASYHKIDRAAGMSVPVPIGRPVANTSVYILNNALKLQPKGVAGEICISGKGVASGYRNLDALTEKCFVPDPYSSHQKMYRTGDLGYWLADGNIEFKGRIDSQIKLRGYRIEPGEIENLLLTHPAIDQAVVLVKGQDEQKELVAYFVGEQQLLQQDITLFVKQRLPAYMIPAYFIRLNKMPVTINGKIDINKIREIQVGHLTAGEKKIVQPGNEEERKMVDIWKQILKTESLGVTDNFFEHGGHSLKGLQLISAINKEMDTGYRLQDLFNFPTVGQLVSSYQRTTRIDRLVISFGERIEGIPNLYMLPPVLGSATVFSKLAGVLGSRFNSFGFQYSGLGKGEKMDGSVQAIAARICAVIRQIHPEGSCRLLGYSMGALVAFEIAKQLEQEGMRVALYLIDREALGNDPLPADRFTENAGFEMEYQTGNNELLYKEALPAAYSAVYRNNIKLLSAYSIHGMIKGSITVFESLQNESRTNMREWNRYCSGHFSYCELEGNHQQVFDAVNLATLSSMLEKGSG